VRAIIVGGGIDGLSMAIAPRRTGEEATVFKRAGISLWANAMNALRKLGLLRRGASGRQASAPQRGVTLLAS
jgi:2-polyprenyl-6-methoxyphenol hydroxylase-like FAD-dependent oxidoreductase